MDNFLRPVLIKRGADLPLLLIFAGVIGGLLAFGLIGIFVGPVVLAVAYTLVGACLGRARAHRAARGAASRLSAPVAHAGLSPAARGGARSARAPAPARCRPGRCAH